MYYGCEGEGECRSFGLKSGQDLGSSEKMPFSSQSIEETHSYADKSDIKKLALVGKRKRGVENLVLDLREDVTFAQSYNNGTLKIPFLTSGKKRRTFCSDLARDYILMKSELEGGEVKFINSEFENFLAENHLFVCSGVVYCLSYRSKQVYSENGIANYPVKGYSMISLTDLPFKGKTLFFYCGFYLLFFDPNKWEYDQEKYARGWRNEIIK